MSKAVSVGIKLLHPDAKVPAYAHEGDACADVYTLHGCAIPPGYTVEFKTGIAFEIPTGWMIEARPRSGLACKRKLMIPNSPSTIDEGFKGEFIVYMHNFGDTIQEIYAGDRICQIRPVRVDTFKFETVESLSESDRGSGGFGSSGR